MVDAMLQACQSVLVLSLNHFPAEDIAFIPDTLDLHFELEWTEFQQFNNLQVSSVDHVSWFQKHNVFFNVDLLVLHFGWDVLLLEEVGHLDVDLRGAHRHNHLDVTHVAVLAVGVQAVLLDDFVDLTQVALGENAPIYSFKALYQLVHSLPVSLLDRLLQFLNLAFFLDRFRVSHLKCLACETVFNEHDFVA